MEIDGEGSAFDSLMPETLETELTEKEKRQFRGEKTKKKPKLPPKAYRGIEELQELIDPEDDPVQTQELFDPIKQSEIDLATMEEKQMNRIQWQDGEKKLKMTREDIQNEQIKHINIDFLTQKLQNRAQTYKMTVHPDIPYIMALALEEHLKDRIETIAKWSTYRMDMNRHNTNLVDVIDKSQEYIDEINKVASEKEEKERKDEGREALLKEFEELKVRSIDSILSGEERSRLSQLNSLLKKDPTEESASLHALGGDFVFSFNKKKKKKKVTNADGSVRSGKDNELRIQMCDVIKSFETDRKYFRDYRLRLMELYSQQT